MTRNFEPNSNSERPAMEDSVANNSDIQNQSINTLDTLKRDRFELLSAYLDSEVTAIERRQVEDWLATDPEVQRLYARLLKLRQGLQTLPTPSDTESTQKLAAQVFARLDQQRSKRRAAWGGAAIAALFVGGLLGVLPKDYSPWPQFAQAPQNSNSQVNSSAVKSSQPKAAPDALMIALDRPVVDIPKAPISVPAESIKRSFYRDTH